MSFSEMSCPFLRWRSFRNAATAICNACFALVKSVILPSSLLMEDLHHDCCGMTHAELILSEKHEILQSWWPASEKIAWKPSSFS